MALVQPDVVHTSRYCRLTGTLELQVHITLGCNAVLASIAVLLQRGGVSGPVHISICNDSLCPRRLSLRPGPNAAPQRPCLAYTAARQSVSFEVDSVKTVECPKCGGCDLKSLLRHARCVRQSGPH